MNQPPQDSAGQSRLDILIADYMSQVDESVDVDVNEFLKPHPDLADEFRDYLRNSRLADAIAPGDSQSNPQASRDTTPSMAVDETIAPRDVSARPGSAGSVSKHPTRREYDASQTRQATSGSQGDFSLTLPEPTLPRPFGRYELIRLLGRGAMGSVYLAEDAELKRQVALKIPKFTSGTDHDRLLERFAREARSAAAIEHPNICPVYDIGEHDGQSFIAMMLVAGKTLGDLIRDSKRIDPRVAITLTRKIALALAEAHDRGIIHRDLKPSNIMINQRNEPIVMDFGLAREIDSEGQEQLTQDGTIVGTPTYMSPEQVDGIQGNVGTASDIYSLGVVFYELLTGRVPFTGRTLSVMAQIASKQPPPPTSIRADLSPHIEATCLKMMHKQATHRQESMHQVAEELAALLRGDVPTVVGNVAAPVTGAQLKAQSDQVHALIKASDWPEAERVLMQMESNESPVAANYAKWASEQLVTVRATLAQKRNEANLAYQRAESRMKRHDYVGAMGLISNAPKSVRSPAAKALLNDAVEAQTQVDALFKQIHRNLQTGQLSGMLTHLQRLLELKPDDLVAQYLFRKYKWQSRFGAPAGWLADAFAPSQSAVTRPTYEEPFLRKWIGIATLVFVLFTIATAASVTIYIKQKGKQAIAIRVSDEALAEGKVEVVVEMDNDESADITKLNTGSDRDQGEYLGAMRMDEGPDQLLGLAFSSDAKKIVSVSRRSQMVRVWDTESREELHAVFAPKASGNLAISHDGSLFIPFTDGVIQFDLNTMEILDSIEGPYGWRKAIAVSPEGRFLATADARYGGRILEKTEVGDYREVFTFERGPKGWQSLSYAKNPARFLIAGTQMPYQTINIENDFEIKTLNRADLCRPYPDSIDVSFDGSVFQDDNYVRSTDNGDLVSELNIDAESRRMHPNGRSLLGFLRLQSLAIYNISDAELKYKLPLPATLAGRLNQFQVAISPNGQYAVAAGRKYIDSVPGEKEEMYTLIHLWRLPEELWQDLRETPDSKKVDEKKLTDTRFGPSDAKKVSDTVSNPWTLSLQSA